MIDTHAHIDFEAFDEDRQDMIQRALNNGIEFIVIPAVEPKHFDKLLDLTSNNERLFCGMGVHPHNALDANEYVYEQIIENCKNENVRAIGETGIDYFYDFAPKDLQKDVFRRHLQIAKQTSLPVIVHNREADDDILDIIRSEQDGTLKGVLHCFSSPIETMEKALDLGFNISFTGNVTFKKSQMDEVIEKTPLDRIMLETDSPFMTPAPNRGKRNEPANVKYVAQKIAEIKSISIDEVIAMTSKTARLLFNLSFDKLRMTSFDKLRMTSFDKLRMTSFDKLRMTSFDKLRMTSFDKLRMTSFDKLRIISLIILIFLFTMSVSFSQSIVKDIEKEELQVEELIHPYPKFFGIGPVIGTNTVVETWYLDDTEADPSYDGLFAYGGALTYGALDYLVLKLSYCYSKNKKIAEQWDNTIDPSIYQFVELSSHWIINPYSRINFFGTLGLTSFLNSENNKPNKQIGWNAGVGMFINLPTDYGLFNLMAEWHINFETVKREKYYSKSDKDKNIFTEMKAYYSIPRATILYYPPIKKWLGMDK